jgi:hypothetical protein
VSDVVERTDGGALFRADDAWSVGRICVPVPHGWFVKESFTLLAPDGQANVIVSREPLASDIDLTRYAAIQGELLRREFPHYVEHEFDAVVLPSGSARHRRFAWTPPGGERVEQRQLYFVTPGTGFTATATAPETHVHRFGEVFDEVLHRAIFW